MTAEPTRSAAAPPKQVRLVELTPAVIAALADHDLDGASARSGVVLTEFLIDDRAQWLWRLRLDQIAADPSSSRWVARAAVSEPDGQVIGYTGFHGPPDEAGMVEIGYSVDPAARRQGYARAILTRMLQQAADEPDVTTVRVTISPDNAASLATIAGFGFVHKGEQWDEEDGLELIFEVPANPGPHEA